MFFPYTFTATVSLHEGGRVSQLQFEGTRLVRTAQNNREYILVSIKNVKKHLESTG